jgi:hypothetical protein
VGLDLALAQQSANGVDLLGGERVAIEPGASFLALPDREDGAVARAPRSG